jgi:hypothetical protein
MIKVGDLVRLDAAYDTFHRAEGLVVQRVEAEGTIIGGYYFRVLLLCGTLIIGLPDELELLENEVETKS